MNSRPQPYAESEHIAELARAAAAGELTPLQLIDQLADSDWVERRALVAVLAGLGDPAITPMLDALLARRDDEARIAALVDAISASIGAVEAPVVALTEHPDPAIVADATQILGRRRSFTALPTLIALTNHDDDNVAVSAIEALGRIGGQSAVDALIACVESNNFFRTFPAIDVLGRSGDPRATEPLSRLLDNPRYAFEAARALGRSLSRAAVAPLLNFAQRGSGASVRVACLALSELLERHAERYGVATVIETQLEEARSEPLVRRIGQGLSHADRSEKVAMCRVLGALRDGAAIPWLLPLLDTDKDSARAASRALESIGRDSDPAIDRALVEPHSSRRAVLLPSISRGEHGYAVIACLEDHDPYVRALAAEALGRLGFKAATPRLFALLSDQNPRVVLAACGAIQALGSNDTQPLALAAARSDSGTERLAALRILAYFGYERALDTFLAALRSDDARMRDAAAQGLALLENPSAREALIEAATSADAPVRAVAMRALGQRGSDPALVAVLRDGLSDPDAWVRYYASQSLGRLHADVASELAKLLTDAAGQVRVAAVEALAQLGGDVPRAALREAAVSEDLDVRRAALVGLGLMDDAGSLQLLLDAVRGDDAPTRLVALSSLTRHPSDEVVAALARAANDEDEAVRVAAIGLLQGVPSPAASDALVALVRRGTERTRALEALSQPTDPAHTRVEALLRALDDADDELAPMLVSCLSKLERHALSEGLVRAMLSPNRRARLATAHALSALGTREAFAALADAARDDTDSEVRRVCALHLAS